MAGIGTVWVYQGVSVYSMYPNDEQGVGMESNTMNTISESVSLSPSSSIGRIDYNLPGPRALSRDAYWITQHQLIQKPKRLR